MNEEQSAKTVFALVVYAKRNVRDMARKAFRSITAQSRIPDKLIVVDDQSEAGFDDVKERVIDLNVDGCHVQILRNERTPGLSGALNTAILKVMEYADGARTYVAFMREEDQLDPTHFRKIERATRGNSRSVVFADVSVQNRRGAKTLRMARATAPEAHLRRIYSLDLDFASCLMGAFAVRLDVLLEAGLLNEALRGEQSRCHKDSILTDKMTSVGRICDILHVSREVQPFILSISIYLK